MCGEGSIWFGMLIDSLNGRVEYSGKVFGRFVQGSFEVPKGWLFAESIDMQCSDEESVR